MASFRRTAVLACLSMVAACSGGSGSGSAAGPAWPKFRHDSNNSGQAVASVSINPGTIKGIIDLKGTVSASPAINIEGTVYIGTETCTAAGCPNTGTFFAVSPDSLQPRWTIQENGKCQGDDQLLGPMVSSPAVHTLAADTSIFVGSESGRVHAFKDTLTATQPTAVFCFDPTRLPSPFTVTKARFASSPSFITSPVSAAVDGVFIGAEVETAGTAKEGRIYALANDGSLRWQFPRAGSTTTIGPVTSSVATALDSIYFVTDDGLLYALGLDGNLKWSRGLGSVRDPAAAFAVSPVATSTGVFVATIDGTVIAFNPNGSERWRRSDPSHLFQGSLAFGDLPITPEPTLTATPLESSTPEPTATGEATATPTPTTTPIPLLSVAALFGVTKNGELVVLQASAPTPAAPPLGAPVEGDVIGSPALSGDGQIVFASSTAAGGLVHVIDLVTGLPPATPTGTPAPVPWPKTIDGTGGVSSPVLANDGTIWLATSDGKLYAIGTK